MKGSNFDRNSAAAAASPSTATAPDSIARSNVVRPNSQSRRNARSKASEASQAPGGSAKNRHTPRRISSAQASALSVVRKATRIPVSQHRSAISRTVSTRMIAVSGKPRTCSGEPRFMPPAAPSSAPSSSSAAVSPQFRQIAFFCANAQWRSAAALSARAPASSRSARIGHVASSAAHCASPSSSARAAASSTASRPPIAAT